MKTNAFVFVLTFVFFSFYTCDSPLADQTEAKVQEVLPVGIVENSTPLTDDTIHVNTAEAWVARWNTKVNNGGGYTQTHPLYAFDIPHEDVNNIFSNSEAKTFRVYLGISDTEEYKVAVVGVDSSGKDLINPSKGIFVYDLSTPCPPFCDTSSVLYMGHLVQ